MFKLNQIKNIDLVIVVCTIILCIIGALNVFSTTFYKDKTVSNFFYNQIIFYALGFIILFFLSIFNFNLLKNRLLISLVYLITLFLLIAVLFYGEEVFGTKRWINIGFFNLQPSEFAKLTIIIFTSFLTSQKLRFKNLTSKSKSNILFKFIYKLLKQQDLIKLTICFLSIGIIIILIFLEKSLGNTLLSTFIFFLILSIEINITKKLIGIALTSISALILNLEFYGILSSIDVFNIKIYEYDINLATLFFISLIIYLISKVFKVKVAFLIFVFITFFNLKSVINYSYENILEDYQKDRIESYIGTNNSDNDLTTNWNKRQSIAAIGSAGLLGKGFLNSKLANTGYLPFAYTDFAYAAYAEQYGFAGTIFLLLIYLILLIRITSKAANIEDKLAKTICYGVSFMFFLNIIQHIGMNLGKLPITGVPLPLISYGGSSIASIFIGLGLVLCVTSTNSTKKIKVVKKYY